MFKLELHSICLAIFSYKTFISKNPLTCKPLISKQKESTHFKSCQKGEKNGSVVNTHEKHWRLLMWLFSHLHLNSTSACNIAVMSPTMAL